MGHLRTPLLLALAVLFVLGLVRWGVPFFLANAGPGPLRTVLGVGGHPNVPKDVQAWAGNPVQYVGAQTCRQCHGDRVAQWSTGSHATISCESCHGPAREHVEGGASPEVDASPALCAQCHSKVPGRPVSFPQVVLQEHAGGLPCTACHNPHSPALGAAGQQAATPTATPTVGAQGTEQTPVPAPPTPTPTIAASPTPTPVPAAQTPPQVPHSVQGRSDCLACHGPGRLRPYPDGHAGRQSDTCLLCHRTR